jgi:hypothetical protein
LAPAWHRPLPPAEEALALKAFRGWFLCIRCGRCGETRIVNEAQTPWQDLRLVYVLRRLRHAGCGGEAASVELHSRVEGGHRRLRMRRIVLRGGWECARNDGRNSGLLTTIRL